MAPLTQLLAAREEPSSHMGHPNGTQIGYNLTSLLCLVAVSYMATVRIRQYRKARIIYPARVLASATYMTVLVYIIILNMLASGAGISSAGICKASIYICLVFYGTVKGLLLYFLAERVRTIRSMRMPRGKDKLWIATIIVITMGLCGVVGAALVNTNSSYDSAEFCKVGIPNGQTTAVLMFDTAMNLWLTGSFLWLLRPILQEHAELQGSGQMSSFVQRLFSIRHRRRSSADVHLASQLRTNRFASVGDDSTANQTAINEMTQRESKGPQEYTAVVTESPSKPTDSDAHSSHSSTAEEHVVEDKPHSPFHTTPLSVPRPSDTPTLNSPAASPNLPSYPYGPPGTTPITTSKLSTIRRLDMLVRKSLAGTFLLFAPCIANGILYWYFKGFEPAWLCLTACSIDVTMAVGVLHWLTENGEDDA